MIRQTLLTMWLASAVVAFTGCTSSRSDTTWRAPHSALGAHSIPELLDVLAASKARFQYLVDTEIHVETGPEMASTLRAKFVKAGSPEITPIEFVDRFATHSDGEGATYYVRLPDGKRQALADWLKQHVAR